MAYLGAVMLLIALCGGWLLWRKKLERAKWFQRAAIGGIAAPFPRLLRRLDPDRDRSPAVDRLRPPDDGRRRVADLDHDEGRVQPRRVRALYSTLAVVDF